MKVGDGLEKGEFEGVNRIAAYRELDPCNKD